MLRDVVDADTVEAARAGVAGGGGQAARRAAGGRAGRGGPPRPPLRRAAVAFASACPRPARTRPLHVVPVPGHGGRGRRCVGDDGTVYTGTEDGSVFARPTRRRPGTRVGRTGGRPLGLELLADGRLLVCDAHARAARPRHRAPGASSRSPTEVDGRPMRLLQQRRGAPRTARSGSPTPRTVHPIERVEGRHRRGHPHRPAAAPRPRRPVEVVVDGLRFANGVALARRRVDFVCVAETGGADRRTPVADRRPQAGRPTTSRATCRATRTTSRAAPTASSG